MYHILGPIMLKLLKSSVFVFFGTMFPYTLKVITVCIDYLHVEILFIETVQSKF